MNTPWIDNGYSDEKKIDIIESHFYEIMNTLGMDLSDDSLIKTPSRVAKMFVKELFYGLAKDNYPRITTIDNKFNYDQMLIESNIVMNSCCEHHFIPMIGYAHVAYIPKKKIIGLSKINRIVDYFSKRPQVQERLTNQIQNNLTEILKTENVAIVIDAVHCCVRVRGIKDASSITRTSMLGGVFKKDQKARQEFFNSIPKISDFKL